MRVFVMPHDDAHTRIAMHISMCVSHNKNMYFWEMFHLSSMMRRGRTTLAELLTRAETFLISFVRFVSRATETSDAK